MDHPAAAHEDGRPVNPVVLTAWCRRKFGKLHELWHSHASHLLSAGVNIKAVSSRLGHISASLTLSTYAHLPPGADQDAAQRIDKFPVRQQTGSRAVTIALSLCV
ncbi:MAG: tyrosine-type recombinase/integrase [Alphaproteobacteria bacterium]|nr:tyrosine-type recombinase/integrase [Alphaproteobacteria bacterium]